MAFGMTPEEVVDHLTYCSYRAQRSLYGMSAERCKRLWPETGDAMEARYQTEIAINAARSGNDHSNAASGDAQDGGTNSRTA